MYKQKSIKSNLFYNILLKITNILFPILIFPYIARVLSPTGVGKIDFSLSFIQYFIIIAVIGIPTYAVRECAKVRDDKDKLTKKFQEIFKINLFTLFISYILFVLFVLFFSPIESYSTLLWIFSINIISTCFGIEWFYQAIEKYKYITIRSVIIKIITLASIFVFVKNENDLIIYSIIIMLSSFLSYFYNLFYLRKHIYIFKKYDDYNYKQHLKPVLVLFALSVSTSIYLNLDKVMLGFITGDASVGIYSAANKIIRVILSLITSIGVVLLPRMAYYIQHNEKEEINKLINKSFNFILIFSIPATIGIILLAEPIILLFAGPAYTEAILTIKILCPIIIAIGISNLIGIQILVSYGKEKITMFSTLTGAIINFSLNFLLIPILSQNGAALSSLVAEIVVVIFQIIFAYRFIKGNISLKSVIIYLIGSLLIFLTIYLIDFFISDIILFTFLSIVLSIPIYFGFLFLTKNQFVLEFSKRILIKFKILK